MALLTELKHISKPQWIRLRTWFPSLKLTSTLSITSASAHQCIKATYKGAFIGRDKEPQQAKGEWSRSGAGCGRGHLKTLQSLCSLGLVVPHSCSNLCQWPHWLPSIGRLFGNKDGIKPQEIQHWSYLWVFVFIISAKHRSPNMQWNKLFLWWGGGGGEGAASPLTQYKANPTIEVVTCGTTIA